MPSKVKRGKRTRRAARIVAIGGGKGGVGKSVLSANLSVAMAERGHRVFLIDADLGMANQHTLFGIERPGAGLQALINREVTALVDTAIPTGIENLQLIPGSGGIPGAANIGHAQKRKLLRHIGALDADVVVIDCGAGVAFNTLDLYDASDLRVAVMTPQVTSIQNAYGFLKGAIHRVMTDVADTKERKALVAEAGASRTAAQRIQPVLHYIRDRDPGLAATIEQTLSHFAARIVGNWVHNDRERRVVHSIARLVRDFLGVHATVIGALPMSRELHESVNRRAPLLTHRHPGPAGSEIRNIARALLAENVQHIRAARERRLEESAAQTRAGDLAREIGASVH